MEWNAMVKGNKKKLSSDTNTRTSKTKENFKPETKSIILFPSYSLRQTKLFGSTLRNGNFFA